MAEQVSVKPAAQEDKQQGAHAKQEFVPPPYWKPRVEIFEKLFARHRELLAAKPRVPIEITLPGGDIFKCNSWECCAFDVVKRVLEQGGKAFPKSILEEGVVARLDNKELFDMTRPLERSCSLEVLTFQSEEGRHVFWHSSAHILGQALEKKYHALLNVGPPTEKDFFYDVKVDESKQVSAADFKDLLSTVQGIVKQKQPFQRIEASREEASSLFGYNKYKLAIVDKTPVGETISVYRCGQLVDLCRGPHIPNTGYARGFALNSTCSVYAEGKSDSDVLQRVYAISFPSKEQLQDYEEKQRQAALRDHRTIGKQQELFFFHPLSPGSCFFQPHGFRIYLKLQQYIREQYHRRGYQEVLTPNLFQSKLWEISGHWDHYKDCMFTLKCDDVTWGLKPMNCPGHCLVFQNRVRSYRELPIRMAECGVLHRNELVGALHGLTRVRRFEQDDTHIFCRKDQIKQEVEGCFEFVKFVYMDTFHFDVRLELSTRPENFMGEIEVWNRAEHELEEILKKCGMEYKINPGDGAFYGPKIDVHVKDALDRYHQCATIQLDFQLPIKFDLSYMTEVEGKTDRPVMVHRAILGSFERFIGILTEHLAGKWPFWLSPRQVVVLPISDKFVQYAKEVEALLHDAYFFVDVDDSGRSLQKRVREAQLSQYNFILVVGQEEAANRTVSIRSREGEVRNGVSLQQLLEEFKKLVAEYK